MNFIQRVLARTVFGLDVKQVALMRETWKDGQAEYAAPTFANYVAHGYRKNEVIYACIATTADSAAQVSLKVRSKKTGLELEEHPLAKLLQQPNPFMSEYDFWTAVISFQYLAGRAFFEKERNRAGQVIHLWPLRPDWVQIIPSTTTLIAGYKYGPPGVEPVTLKPEDVLDFPVFDPLNAYGAVPPVGIAARVGQVDNSATDFIKLFFEKGAAPSGYLKTKQKITSPAEVSRIQQAWMARYGGMDKWLAPAVLDSDAEYQRTGFTFQEMDFETLDARNEARICMVLRVPPVIVHARMGLAAATDNNYEIEERAWWRNRLLPLYANFEDVIENRLLPDFAGEVPVDLAFDTSGVYALQEDIQRRWERATNALRAGGITRNQFLAQVGQPSMGAGGEVYLLPMAVTEVPARSARSADAGKTLLPSGDSKARLAPPDRQKRNEAEAVIAGVMERYFEGLLKRVEDDVRAGGHA